jgi:Putative prokaryotic signal transducing protein
MASSGEGLRRLTSARDLVEAEMIEQFLLGAGIHCLIRRAPAFDVPEFLAAGRRELLVRAADYAEARSLVESHFGLA